MQETRVSIEKAFSKSPAQANEVSSCAESEPFALQVTDSSMEPEFSKGCVIIIDPSIAPHQNAYVLARDNAGEYIFRQYQLIDGLPTLQALQEGIDRITLHDVSQIEGVITQQSGARRKSRKHYI